MIENESPALWARPAQVRVFAIRTTSDYTDLPCGRKVLCEYSRDTPTYFYLSCNQFINLLTNDDNIHIGHNQQSETFGVQTTHYIDRTNGSSVMLIDTPGFDDSRECVTDTDLLEKIVRFLDPESGQVHFICFPA